MERTVAHRLRSELGVLHVFLDILEAGLATAAAFDNARAAVERGSRLIREGGGEFRPLMDSLGGVVEAMKQGADARAIAHARALLNDINRAAEG